MIRKKLKIEKVDIQDRNTFDTIIAKLKPQKIFLITNDDRICYIAKELVDCIFQSEDITYKCSIISNMDSTVLKVRNSVDAFWESDADILLTIGDESFSDVAKAICIIVADNIFSGTASIEGIANKSIVQYPFFTCSYQCVDHIWL